MTVKPSSDVTATEAPGGSTASDSDLTSTPAPAPRSRRAFRRLGILLISLLGPIVIIAFGIYIYLVGGGYVSTDNAYVKSDKIAISADVSGRVVEVAIRANQSLEAGDLLFRIDREPFQIALGGAEARLASARQDMAALRAQYHEKRAQLALADGDVAYYLRQHDRKQKLNTKGFASETNLDTANKDLRNARDQLNAIKQSLAQVVAKLGGDPELLTEHHPSVREARSARDRAALDLRRTEVRAPVAGVVTNFELQTGEYIKAGDVVFSLVGTHDVWIRANFKETDLTHMRVGQTAKVRVDAYPGKVREAVVSSIGQATGAEFALLPPQNATGNWVKVVQRLPVRLKLKQPLSEPPLRAGMSVVVDVETGHRRRLPHLADTALIWVMDLR
ncbi:MAG: HlyD family efflux transporter periplasmic adaptor subunit [Methyloligellaceae bacterium]